MSSALQICRYAERPGEFLDILSRAECPFADAVSFPIIARYYETYFGSSYRGDISFLMHRDGDPAAIVRGQAVNGNIVDNSEGVSVDVRDAAALGTAILDELDSAARRTDCRKIRILEPSAGGCLTALGRGLAHRRAMPRVWLLAIADLSKDESALRRGLRKSYRSLVNSGLRDMQFRFVTETSFDAGDFEAFRKLHVQVAGRETRSSETWNLQAQLIESGRAELLLSYLDGYGLVGASYFMDTGATTFYGIGVYDRSLFEKPLAHAAIFSGLLRAKARGQSRFLLGPLPTGPAADDKEFSIGWFKSGFTEDVAVCIDWSYEIDAGESS